MFQAVLGDVRIGQQQILKMRKSAQRSEVIIVDGAVLEIDLNHRPIAPRFIDLNLAAALPDASEGTLLIGRQQPQPTRRAGTQHDAAHNPENDTSPHRRTSLSHPPSAVRYPLSAIRISILRIAESGQRIAVI